MPKIKFWNGTSWVTLDFNNLESVDGIHFRINSGKLQYSTNGTTWVNV